ncbi:SDR family NAD(P)-dependent oxidoreductase [Georgenia sp. Z1491]|uniref:SDR family NAD(P)-dependent oxidoreductase n=1 Tax=Georgenia sp. Z1491 TaxID=3416707 RepID=UPI003CF3215B
MTSQTPPPAHEPAQARDTASFPSPTITPGTTAVITGGARGIGATFVEAFAAAGARVVIAGHREPGPELAARLTAEGHEVTFHPTDVGSPDSVADLAAHCEKHLGHVDVLLNNASYYMGIGSKKSFDDITLEEWDQVLRVNATGTWLTIKALHPLLRASGRGRIINIGSTTVHGVPFNAHYVASKGAVHAITRSLAKELGDDGITVNVVVPGLVESEATLAVNDPGYLPKVVAQRAIKRSEVPEDLVGAAMFLASESAGFITGQSLIVDGGIAFS